MFIEIKEPKSNIKAVINTEAITSVSLCSNFAYSQDLYHVYAGREEYYINKEDWEKIKPYLPGNDKFSF